MGLFVSHIAESLILVTRNVKDSSMFGRIFINHILPFALLLLNLRLS